MPRREQHWTDGVAAELCLETGNVVLWLFSDDNHEIGFYADELDKLISGCKEAMAVAARHGNRTCTS